MRDYKNRLKNSKPTIKLGEIVEESGLSGWICWKFTNDPAYIPKEGNRDKFEAALSALEAKHAKENNARIDAEQARLEGERTKA